VKQKPDQHKRLQLKALKELAGADVPILEKLGLRIIPPRRRYRETYEGARQAAASLMRQLRLVLEAQSSADLSFACENLMQEKKRFDFLILTLVLNKIVVYPLRPKNYR
jgi:hypothetical protein